MLLCNYCCFNSVLKMFEALVELKLRYLSLIHRIKVNMKREKRHKKPSIILEA